jgi:hypothetical protein
VVPLGIEQVKENEDMNMTKVGQANQYQSQKKSAQWIAFVTG